MRQDSFRCIDYREIAKYTGVLYPYNMEVFRDRLARTGMSEQAEDFFLASGRWATELYKADIENGLTHGGDWPVSSCWICRIIRGRVRLMSVSWMLYGQQGTGFA